MFIFVPTAYKKILWLCSNTVCLNSFGQSKLPAYLSRQCFFNSVDFY